MGSVVVTGPPGSGKTTVARLLAERTPRGVHLDADHFFHMITSGYIDPWKPEASAQNSTVITAVAAAAVNYAVGGYEVFVDGILGPWYLDEFTDQHAQARVRLSYVVLYPPIDIALARAANRGRTGLTDETPIRHMHSEFSRLGALETHVIDNAALTAEETTALIQERLSRGDFTLTAA